MTLRGGHAGFQPLAASGGAVHMRGSGPSSSGPSDESRVSPMRLYVIPAGTLRIDKGAVFTPGIDDGVLIEIPVPVYLIRTDNDENVLVDTGLHPAHIDDPSHSFGLENADEVLARMQPEDRLERRLAEVGLGIVDITHVVHTHLHPDHCGGNFLFPTADTIA